MLPKVSVMIPTYNHQSFIRDCLESVLNQNYPNLEIIVSDDASTDGNQKIIQEYKQNYPEIFKIILSNENKGITSNSNLAFYACTGKYIAFFSGDDVMLPGKLLKQATFMEEHPNCVLSHHNIEFFDSDSGKGICNYYGPWSTYPKQGEVEILVRYGCVAPISVMARREACPADGYNPKIPVASDWLFFIETAAKGGQVLYFAEILGRYRRHANNASDKITDNSEQLKTLEIIEEKYPSLLPHIKVGRRRVVLRHLVKKFLIQFKLNFLYKVIRKGLYIFRWIGWLFRKIMLRL